MKMALFVLAFMAFDGWWWLRLNGLLRHLPGERAWRALLAAFLAAVLVYPVWLLVTYAGANRYHHIMPEIVPASAYIWHLLTMPIAAVLVGTFLWARWIVRRSRPLIRRLRRSRQTPATAPPVATRTTPPPSPRGVSRRQFLAAAAVAGPPLATVGLAQASLFQLGKFRVKPMHLAIPSWHPSAGPFSIAVVADIHTGIFTDDKMLADVARATNELRADVVCFLGDLINSSLRDLSAGIDTIRKMDAPHGVYLIEGNHDLFQNPQGFRNGVRAAGLRLLCDQSADLKVNGFPVQLLGVEWGNTQAALYDSVRAVAAARDPDAFPILLAHHPHAWDAAAPLGLPLTLSGHTHGGQIMLTKHIGGGPLRFRYWTGLYQRPGSSLIVSNGVGNWFPLRVNAPAEIIKL